MFGQWVRAILFPAIPLAALAWAAPRGWTAVFRRVRGRDVGWMFAFAALNIVVSLAVATPIKRVIGAEANPVGGILQGLSPAGRISFYLATAPQLLGEEVVTILPMLALIYALTAKVGWSRRVAVAVAWVVTALVFGAMHLPTYNWNFVQCFAIIGAARLVLSGAYLWTKNLWVSTGAHIINDWVLFSVPLLLGGAAIIV
jgi:membrane protease YdiL (CAAX protease family)